MTSEAALRDRLAAEGLAPSSWGNGPHDHYAEHRHTYDKVLVAISGSITLHLRELGRDVLLQAGGRLDLPAGTLHSADVGPSGVNCMEAHLAAGSLAPEPSHVGAWSETGGAAD